MIQIRQLEPKDYQQIAYLDRSAFSTHYRKTYGVTKLPERTSEGMEAYGKRSGSEGLVMEENNQVIGYVFLHQWGSLGWLGPVGIDPSFQGRGLGKALLEHAIDILDKRHVQEIGLETMVDSPTNIGLYMSLGFQPLHLSFDLARTVKSIKEIAMLPPEPPRPEVRFTHYKDYNEDEFQRLTEISRDLTGAVIRGLDYQPELELMLKYGFGRVLLMEENDEPVGIALVMTKDMRGQEGLTVSIRGLVIKPGTMELEYTRLSELLRATYDLTREVKCSKILLTVYSDNDAPTRYLLKHENFTISFPYLRMVMNDAQYPVHQRGIELSKWRG